MIRCKVTTTMHLKKSNSDFTVRVVIAKHTKTAFSLVPVKHCLM